MQFPTKEEPCLKQTTTWKFTLERSSISNWIHILNQCWNTKAKVKTHVVDQMLKCNLKTLEFFYFILILIDQ